MRSVGHSHAGFPRSPLDAVVFDFYGTLARASRWVSISEVLADHGASVSEEVMRSYFEGHDGVEHVEHSRSRDHYVAWQRTRMLTMLAETDVHPGEYDLIVDKLRHGTSTRVLQPYDEVGEVLDALGELGCALAICSNWDWDLDEAVEEVGLAGRFDVVMSSAWAGARKPHPRIFAETLSKLGTDPARTLFVGDTWGPDVEGPLVAGMRPVYLERESHWPDPGAPDDAAERTARAACITDLRGLLAVVRAGIR
jgi:putative hydrolase of the HAD superfamily